MISVLPNNLSKEPLKLEVKISYETLKKALVQAAKVNNMPVEVVEDKYCVSDGSIFGKLGSKSRQCLVVYHNKHRNDYHSIVLELTDLYDLHYIYAHMGGTSRNQRDINMSKMSRGGSGRLLTQIIGNSAKSKIQDENLYYEAVYNMISKAVVEAEDMTINPPVKKQSYTGQNTNNGSNVGQVTAHSGKSIDKLDKPKLEALIKASDDGEEWAQREYGRIFDEYDMDPDFIELVCQLRINIYQNQAKRGDKNAILRYAHALAYLGRKKEAHDWYMNLIQKGDTDAMLALSEQYNEYGSFGHDPNEEMKWLKLAGDSGNAEAQKKLGLECLCVNDKYNALLWYELSAKQNNPGGKIGYAGCLRDQLRALDEYSKGWAEVTPGRYDYIKKTYGQMSQKQCRAVMRDLFWEIEKLYLDGLKRCNSDSELSDAFSGLSSLYLYPQGVCSPMYYLSAFYDFEQFRVLDNEFAYERCLKTIEENNLKVTEKDLQEWDAVGIYEWAEKHGIDVYAEENSNTKSATDSNKKDEGDLDVHLTLNITEQEARNGCAKIIAVKEIGKKYNIKIPAGTKNGGVLRMVGAGKKDLINGKKGNVFIKIQIHEKTFKAKR